MNIDIPSGLIGAGQMIILPVPEGADDMSLPDPELLDYYLGRRDRQIFITGEIGTEILSYNQTIMQYNAEDAGIVVEDRKPIYVYIFSPGGDLSATYSFIGMLEASKTPVITVNMGEAYSGGGLILMAGHKRYCLRRSQVLVHQGSGGMQGTFSEIEEGQKAYKKSIDQMKKYILERTKIDEKVFNKNKSRDWYFTDEEQVEYGIVDAIVESIEEIM